MKTAHSDRVGMYVTRITDLDYIKVNRIDFGRDGAKRFTANVASEAGAEQSSCAWTALTAPIWAP